MNNLVIVHIGKCGGSTVEGELKRHGIPFKRVHLNKVRYNPHAEYVITIRNPVKRFVSAFYWRKYLVCDKKDQKRKYKNEYNQLKSKTLDNLIDQLSDDRNALSVNKTSGKYIHHLKEDINFYLGRFLRVCPPEQIIGVICTETLKSDMKRLFNINVRLQSKKNSHRYKKNKLSKSHYEKLKRYLVNDYRCINKLFNMGCIDRREYNILSK